nr:MAG TPA: hypothetical protein [Caudoviricetes sp.]
MGPKWCSNGWSNRCRLLCSLVEAYRFILLVWQ